VNDKFEKMWEDMMVAYFKVLSCYLPERGGFRAEDVWPANTDLNSAPAE
jgi:hypothetical protein